MWNTIMFVHIMRSEDFSNFEEQAEMKTYQKAKYALMKELRYHRDMIDEVCLSLEIGGIQQTVKVLNDRSMRTQTF